jgi:glutamine synthetase
MIRIPDGGRVELRLCDNTSNPYLAAAAILAVGLEGIAQKRVPGNRKDFNVYSDKAQSEELRKLPETLLDSLRHLEANPVLNAALGEQVVRAFLKMKQAEWREYNNQVSAWEFRQTVDC